MADIQQVRIAVANQAPLGMTLVKHPRGSMVHKVTADDETKRSALRMILRSITPGNGGERAVRF